MKVSEKEASAVLAYLSKKAREKMRRGIICYGYDFNEDPLEELTWEIADSINYLIFAYIKARRVYERIKALEEKERVQVQEPRQGSFRFFQEPRNPRGRNGGD